MPDVLTASIYVKIAGADASREMMDNMVRVEVDRSLHMPGSFSIELIDQELEWIDSEMLGIGKEIEISAAVNATLTNGQATPGPLFKGFITALEPVFDRSGPRMVVRGYDKLSRLQRGNKTATYLNVKDSDMVSQVANQAGLSAAVKATSTLHEHVLREDISDYDFLQMLARRNGYVMHIDGTQFHFKPPDELNFGQVALKWRENLLEFRPSLSVGGQINEVTIGGWDPKQKKEVVGIASSADFEPSKVGMSKRGYTLAEAEAGGTKSYHLYEVVESQESAQKIATAAFNRLAANDLVGEGLAEGDPKIKAGGTVTLSGVGTNFSGTYLVTRVRHTYDAADAYKTEFWVGGMGSGTVASLVNERRPDEPLRSDTFNGLIPAIVTNSNDPQGLGRVKVKYPQLSAADESFWARVVGLGAGKQRGWYVLPEVNDEVVVGFANGDPNHPYVLGGVWNGLDKPPTNQETAVGSDGKVNIREFKTRAGHVLRFNDESGKEKIELLNAKGSNFLVIDATSQAKIHIETTGDVFVKAGKNATVEAGMNISMKAGMNFDVKAVNFSVDASAKIALKGAMVDVTGSGPVKISGAMVMIN